MAEQDAVVIRAVASPPKIKHWSQGQLRLVLTIRPEHWFSGYNLVKTTTLAHYFGAVGSIYPPMTKLKELGFIKYRYRNVPGSGPKRKEFCLTKKGVVFWEFVWSEWHKKERGLYQ